MVDRGGQLYGWFTAYSVAFLLFKSGRNPRMGRVPRFNSRRRRSGGTGPRAGAHIGPEKRDFVYGAVDRVVG